MGNIDCCSGNVNDENELSFRDFPQDRTSARSKVKQAVTIQANIRGWLVRKDQITLPSFKKSITHIQKEFEHD